MKTDPFDRPLDDCDVLGELWPTSEPPADFADRVLAACAVPAPRPRFAPPRWLGAVAAVAAAVVLPLLLLRAEPASPALSARASFGPDLGTVHD